MKSIWLSVSLLILLSGCISNSLGDREGDDRIVLTDATKRAITVVSVKANELDRRVLPHRIVCAEPSPDIAKAVSSAIESSLSARGDVAGKASGALDASLSRSVTESIAQLGSRLATIQLLRDELSDLCRAYANGAVSSITYTLRLSRLDKKMITLLVSEASAGALSRALISINGSTSIGGQISAEKLKMAEERIENAVTAVSDANTALGDARKNLSNATDDAAKKSAKENIAKAEVVVRNRLEELSDRVIEKWALETRGSGLLATSTASSLASLPSTSLQPLDLRAIHRAYLDDDDLGTLLDACLTSMEDNAIRSNIKDPGLDKLNADLRNKELELQEKSSALSAIEMDYNRTAIHPQRQSDESIKKRDILRAEFDKLSLQTAQLRQQISDLSGAQDRTGLLSFCRGSDGLRRITYLMERKITDRSNLETTRNYIDLCKAALASTAVSSTVKSTCIHSLLLPNDVGRMPDIKDE